MHENLYLIWLSRIEGLGLKKQNLLLNFFKSGENIFNATRKDLESLEGLSKSNIDKIIRNKKDELLKFYEKELIDKDIKYISRFDEKFPIILKEIYDPPLGLYVAGNLPSEHLPKIGIIGSRRCSEYGLTVAHKISKDLAQKGVVIVSGMARGIDSQSHIGALETNGYTLAVLGCGVDVCYPAENEMLRDKIIKNGCVVSEFPPGAKAIPAYFPIRNRIISGISKAIIVVEAGEKSGTLITVDQALEQGREVFAVPGNVTSKLSVGTNRLIKQGATILMESNDILEFLGYDENNFYEIKNDATILLAQEEKLVYDCISLEPVDLEQIIIETKNQLSTVLYILMMLEVKGYIKKLPGQRYIKSL